MLRRCKYFEKAKNIRTWVVPKKVKKKYENGVINLIGFNNLS